MEVMNSPYKKQIIQEKTFGNLKETAIKIERKDGKVKGVIGRDTVFLYVMGNLVSQGTVVLFHQKIIMNDLRFFAPYSKAHLRLRMTMEIRIQNGLR